MGIYDRDYYRPAGPRYMEALGLSGNACKWLIILNVAIYVLQIASRSQNHRLGLITEWLILDPALVLHGQIWRLVTYSFLHELPPVWTHIVFNMWFLWMFGSDVEAIYGTKEFVAFYLVSALVGGIAFELWAVGSGQFALCLGASGAVTAVMVLCACHYPHRIILLFFVLPLPIWVYVLFNVAQDTFLFVGSVKTSTAVTVHLAGAAFGYAYFKMQWRITNLLPSLQAWRRERNRPRLRVIHPDDDGPEALSVGARSGQSADEQLEAKVDAVLEKVARSGQHSLTDSERQILLMASELYKRRRT